MALGDTEGVLFAITSRTFRYTIEELIRFGLLQITKRDMRKNQSNERAQTLCNVSQLISITKEVVYLRTYDIFQISLH